MTSLNLISDSIGKMVEILMSSRNDDGGWGDTVTRCGDKWLKKESDAWTTGEVVFALLNAGIDPTRHEIVDGLNWLHKHQKNGGWGKVEGINDVPATSWALIALMKAGETMNSKAIREGIEWLKSVNLGKDCWPVNPQSEICSTFCTAHALVVFAELLKQTEIKKSPIETVIRKYILPRGRNWLKRVQNENNGWGTYEGERSNAESTSYALLGLLWAAEASSSPALKNGLRWLKKNIQGDGGWNDWHFHGSSLEGTALATLILLETEKNPYPKHVRKGVHWLISHVLLNKEISVWGVARALNTLKKDYDLGRTWEAAPKIKKFLKRYSEPILRVILLLSATVLLVVFLYHVCMYIGLLIDLINEYRQTLGLIADIIQILGVSGIATVILYILNRWRKHRKE